MFQDLTLQWKHVYTFPRIIAIDSKLRFFQYKILYNILHLTQKLFLFPKHNTQLYSLCNSEDEMVIHLFVHCSKTKRLWCTVIAYFKRNLRISLIFPQNVIFGFLEADDKVLLMLNLFYYFSNIVFMLPRSLKVLSFEITFSIDNIIIFKTQPHIQDDVFY